MADPLTGEKLAQVKAAFVLNIARFTRWPDSAFSSPDAPLELCILKDDLPGEAVESIRGKRVGKRTLSVQVVEDSASRCHVLFVPSTQMKWFDRHPKSLEGANLLIVGDNTDQPAKERDWNGETVFLVRDESRIAFEVDLDSARAAGIELSSELLKLSRVIHGQR